MTIESIQVLLLDKKLRSDCNVQIFGVVYSTSGFYGAILDPDILVMRFHEAPDAAKKSEVVTVGDFLGLVFEVFGYKI